MLINVGSPVHFAAENYTLAKLYQKINMKKRVFRSPILGDVFTSELCEKHENSRNRCNRCNRSARENDISWQIINE